MSHLRLLLFVVRLGALEPPELWVCGRGCGWGAALPSGRTILMPAWGGCGGFAAFAVCRAVVG